MRWILMVAFTLGSLAVQAQSLWEGGWLPEISVSHRWSEKWRVSTQLESMQQLYSNGGAGPLDLDYQYIRTDLTAVLSHSLNPNWSLAAGNMFRFSTGDGVTYRSLQQVAYNTRGGAVRFGHRLRTDQTFTPNQPTLWRLRYRLSLEVPLQGQSLDPGEWYWLGSTEQLMRIRRGDSSWEHRLSASLGYYFNARNKLEFGFDYRHDESFFFQSRNRLWTTINYYINL